MTDSKDRELRDFIRHRIRRDKAEGKVERVITRFPPEPNGWLHIGHAMNICLNFSIAEELGGHCNLRFDDTNPLKENEDFVEAIKGDIRWLGFDWEDRLYFASGYFDKLYDFAEDLIEKERAYVCDLSAEEIRATRGTLRLPGRDSPWRERSVKESLDLFRRMREGEFPDGARVLRARIDMADPNLKMRDPVLYRIRHVRHHRTGDRWCIYPMYDFAHCLCDSLEGITHSMCDIGYEIHRPLYDWILDELGVDCHPRQIEYARLNVSNTVLSKRRLTRLVEEGLVSGWDDPRMPTLAGLRRRGVPAEAIRSFIASVGVGKSERLNDAAELEAHVRADLNERVSRAMCVLRPLRVVITNYPEGKDERFTLPNHPTRSEMGTREVPFSRELYIDGEDFLEDPPPGFHRLAPGREVRLRGAYFLRCDEVVRASATGEIAELRCSYDPETRGGCRPPDGRNVKATLHWVSVGHALSCEVRLFDHLFTVADPRVGDLLEGFNPESMEVLRGCKAEPSLAEAASGNRVQFERLGYFCVDEESKGVDGLVFNRTATLRDRWAKRKGGGCSKRR